MNNKEKFIAEYHELSLKYGYDFFSFIDCSSKLLIFLINKFFKGRIIANMRVEELPASDWEYLKNIQREKRQKEKGKNLLKRVIRKK